MEIEIEHRKYSGKRLSTFLNAMQLSDDDIEQLSEQCGFARTTTINQVLAGKAKLHWRTLPVLAEYFDIDPAIFVSLYLDQEVSEDVRESVFETSLRIVPEWEFPLLKKARETYVRETIWTHNPDD